MKSAIYSGIVSHNRLKPKPHAFKYNVFMMYLEVDELEDVLSISKLCSSKRWAPLQFKRKDFHGDASKSIKYEVYRTVKDRIGLDLDGPVYVLSNWRCFGLSFNPLTTYYCFDKDGVRLKAVVAEVTNTPWLERHAYVIPSDDHLVADAMLEKKFTVSPFNPINMQYKWRSTRPSNSVTVGIDNFLDDKKVFGATMHLHRIELTPSSIRTILVRFPFITLKIVVCIYWQALLLFMKGIPFLGKDKVIKTV